jgi:hypothetical protein
MSQMFGSIRASSNKRVAAARLEAADFGTPLGIAKSWHGLHFILAGTIWDATEPPGNVVFGGAEIGEDTGYGPARFMSPPEVIQTADALSRITIEELRKSYDPQAFAAAELYAVNTGDPQELDAILDTFTKVKDYFIAGIRPVPLAAPLFRTYFLIPVRFGLGPTIMIERFLKPLYGSTS